MGDEDERVGLKGDGGVRDEAGAISEEEEEEAEDISVEGAYFEVL